MPFGLPRLPPGGMGHLTTQPKGIWVYLLVPNIPGDFWDGQNYYGGKIISTPPLGHRPECPLKAILDGLSEFAINSLCKNSHKPHR